MIRILSFVTLLSLLFALPAFADTPLNPGFTDELTRSPSAKGTPHGAGCSLAILTTKTAQPIRNFIGGAPVRYRTPAQIEFTSTSTTPTLVCFSQDPTASFNRHGQFTARVGAYAAGGGACLPIPGNQLPTIRLLLREGLSRSRGQVVGTLPRVCTDGVTPCLATSDCTAGGGSGTCRTTGGQADSTYAFLVSDSSSTVNVWACEVE
jgi:hypothetical protein